MHPNLCLRIFVIILVVLGLSQIHSPAHADCLPDTNGDGHPIFGNPEFSLGFAPYEPLEWQYFLSPWRVAVGDLNGDGILDVVTANSICNAFCSTNDSVSIMFGIGDGTVGPPASYEISTTTYPDGGNGNESNPIGLAIADLDGDSDLDIAVGTLPLTLLFNDGNGVFDTRVDIPINHPDLNFSHPSDFEAEDLDNDGDIDLVLSLNGFCFDNRINTWVFLNDGTGTFGQPSGYQTIANPRALAIGDINGDAFLDIVVNCRSYLGDGCHNTFGISALRNNGDGTFSSPVTIQLFGIEKNIALADMDGDLDVDLLLTMEYGVPGASLFWHHVAIYKNTGNGSFELPGTYYPTNNGLESTTAFIVDDLNQDGIPDAAVLSRNSSQGYSTLQLGADELWLHFGDGQGGLSSGFRYGIGLGSEQRGMSLGDMDSDGDVDVVTTNGANAAQGGSSISVLLNDAGSGVFLTDQTFNVGHQPQGVAVADFDHDGYDDIAVANSGSGEVTIMQNNIGNSSIPDSFSQVRSLNVGGAPTAIVAEDMNGDTFADLVVSDVAMNAIFIWLNNGEGEFVSRATVLPSGGGNPGFIEAADIDLDNDLDLIVTNWGGPDIAVYENSGDGTFAAPSINHTIGNARCTAAADFDNDGNLDIATAHAEFYSGYITILRNNGDAYTFSFPQDILLDNFGVSPARIPHSLAAFDVDDDQDVDLVAIANIWSPTYTFSTSKVFVFLNNGDGTFATPIVREQTGKFSWMITADFNNDGRLDLACMGDSANNYSWQEYNIAVLLSMGDGAFADPVRYGIGQASGGRLAVGDFDNNGAIDLVASNTENFFEDRSLDTISVLFNTRCPVDNLCPSDIAGDDDEVNVFDLFVLLSNWNTSGPGATLAEPTNIVNIFDLFVVLSAWGPCN